MTIVVAPKFEDRIVICADTMISDAGAGKEFPLPGTLKALVLNENVSVGYSGNVTCCVDVLRKVRRLLFECTHPKDAGIFGDSTQH